MLNNLIRLKFNPKLFQASYTYFGQIWNVEKAEYIIYRCMYVIQTVCFC